MVCRHYSPSKFDCPICMKTKADELSEQIKKLERKRNELEQEVGEQPTED